MRDEMIMRKMRSADSEGLEMLMDRYIPYVSAVCWNILRNCMTKEDAEEVVSDVFVTAWQKSGDVMPAALKAWLGAVARNKAKTRLRSSGCDLPLEEDVLEIPVEDTPEGILERSEEQKLVRRALDSLTGQDREIFLRHYYYAQTVGEISRDMKINESTAKTKLRRGRMRLKTMLVRWDVR
jgi:RNA polymerase sigma-70 factor (ECF subfamily)